MVINHKYIKDLYPQNFKMKQEIYNKVLSFFKKYQINYWNNNRRGSSGGYRIALSSNISFDRSGELYSKDLRSTRRRRDLRSLLTIQLDTNPTFFLKEIRYISGSNPLYEPTIHNS